MFGFIWTSQETVKLNFTQRVFLEGENELVQNALPNINYLLFCWEEKVAFLGFKREILWNPSLSDFCQNLAGCLPALYPSTWQVAQPSTSCRCLSTRAGSTCRAAGPWAGVQMDFPPKGSLSPWGDLLCLLERLEAKELPGLELFHLVPAFSSSLRNCFISGHPISATKGGLVPENRDVCLKHITLLWGRFVKKWHKMQQHV